MRLDRWCVISRSSPTLQPPEIERLCLHGFVSGHPRCADGKEVTTSRVVSQSGNVVVTKSGSSYELGSVDPAYESIFPNARQRVFARLPSYGSSLTPVYEI